MEPTGELIENRLREGMLAGPWAHRIERRFRQSVAGLAERPGQRRRILIAEPESAEYLGSLLGCMALAPAETFLGDPRWSESDWAEVLGQTAPVEVLGRPGALQPEANEPGGGGANSVLLPTGGTSGRIRFARHTWASLDAAVAGMRRHFGLEEIDSLCVLPLHHVSGLMPLLRAFFTGGRFFLWGSKTLEAGERPDLPPDRRWTLSLVPTQLHRLLAQPEARPWLRRFEIIFLGGAPAWPDLLERAAAEGLRLSLTYGMTETAAQVAALRPEQFLAGERSCGPALPHARLTIVDPGGKALPASHRGRIRVEADSLFGGFFPEVRAPGPLLTDDLGSLDAAGNLTVAGRLGDVINTGGEKVLAGEVESALRDGGFFAEVHVGAVPDPEWGELVAAYYPGPPLTEARLQTIKLRLKQVLSPAKIPKRWIAVEPWPVNPQGKLDRSKLKAPAPEPGN